MAKFIGAKCCGFTWAFNKVPFQSPCAIWNQTIQSHRFTKLSCTRANKHTRTNLIKCVNIHGEYK